MMSDIVERLRSAPFSPEHIQLMRNEAAEEIERLRALKTPASRQLLNVTKAALDHAETEVERLQAMLKEKGHPDERSFSC
jgi:hypothetical protein